MSEQNVAIVTRTSQGIGTGLVAGGEIVPLRTPELS